MPFPSLSLGLGLFLAFQIAPQSLQFRMSVGVGDVLVITPQGVQAFAQILHEVVIVVDQLDDGTTSSRAAAPSERAA